MAPIARKAQSGVIKKAHRKQQPQQHAVSHPRASNVRHHSGSWELVGGQSPDEEDHDDDNDDEDSDPDIPMDGSLDRTATASEGTLNPLREMAERVGKGVETFAETLDKFFTDLPTAANKYHAAKELVEEFKDVADEAVLALKKTHERERLVELRREWAAQARISGSSALAKPASSSASSVFATAGAGASQGKKAEQVALLRSWQQEADLWDLFRLVLETHPPDHERAALRREKREKLKRLGAAPHRYTSEADLWERFLLEDDLGRERNAVKQWLEKTAEHQDSDLSGIVEELETRAGRGKGLWSSGWLHTRERIKGEKRLRSWPNAADSPLPQIRRSDNNDLLVTTLDPDAPVRQQRTTEKQDVFFERALWVVCWEMLRRGKSYQEVSDWCEERKEGWRAVSLGRTQDVNDMGSSSEAWRKTCMLASEAGCSNEYEAAVYGLLGGNVRVVLKVCRTFDDHLYAYYSSMLLRQFDAYVAQVCPWKTPSGTHGAPARADESADEAEQAVVDLLLRLRKGSATMAEANQPMKTIQGYLLGNLASSLITTVGAMVAVTAATLHGTETQDLIEAPPQGVSEAAPETAVALDPQTLRIVAHMAIVLRISHEEQLDAEDLALEENVIVAYMQALRAAGKRDHIPLYASLLQPARYIKALGRMLQDVTEPREQREMLQLMQSFDMDVVSILDSQLKFTIGTALNGVAVETPLRILEKTDETKLWPGQRIKNGFMPDELDQSDEMVLNCLQWFMLLKGHWDTTFAALSTTLRRCLVIGRFACARAIVDRFSYEEVSMQKSYETIGRTINMMDEHTSRPSDDQERLLWNLLKRQSQTYYELELLVRAVESIADWRAEEHTYVMKTPKPNTVPSALKRAKEAVTAAFQPITQGILAPPTSNETSDDLDRLEATELARIRRTYLPELTLAYNVVLHASGNLITRDSLLASMDLSALIARGENGLLDAFREASRVRELVAMFALTSKAMLVLKAEGKPWKMRKDKEGRDLGLWEIGGARLGDDGEGVVEV